MRMRPLPAGLTVPPGGAAALAPGGRHVMLIGLRRPLGAGTIVPLTLHFAGGLTVDMEAPVRPAGGGAPPLPCRT